MEQTKQPNMEKKDRECTVALTAGGTIAGLAALIIAVAASAELRWSGVTLGPRDSSRS